MKIRKLLEKDVDLIFEWMSDSEINRNFRFDPDKVSKASILEFIYNSQNDSKNLHYGIVNDNDEYLGTVSLKNINTTDSNAEYAISLRKRAIGNGTAQFATREILKVAFEELNLGKVYLSVLSENIRAIRFYKKVGFRFEGEFKNHIYLRNEYKSLSWYAIFNGGKMNEKLSNS